MHSTASQSQRKHSRITQICRRFFLPAAMSFVSLSVGLAHAQEWVPERPIEIYEGFGPGGSADLIARQLATAVSNVMPVPIVVVSRPGAAGVRAASLIARARPDGYSMFVGGGSETTSVGNHQEIPYDPRRDFTPVLKVAKLPTVLAVRKDSPYQTIQDLMDAAKKRPGAVSYGSTGQGSLFHSTMLVFEAQSKLEFLHVPYKNASESLLALAGGQIDIAFGAPEEVQGLIKGGQIKPLAVFSASRVPALADVPTIKELGYDIAIDNMKGLMAPPNLPEPIYRYLNKVFSAALQTDSWKRFAAETGLTTDYADGPAFQREINDSYNLIGAVLKRSPAPNAKP